MRSHIIGTIFRKEMLEVLRDKRMLFLVILMPFFLYPVMFTMIGYVGKSQGEKLDTEKVTVLLNPEAESTPIYDSLKANATLDVKLEAFEQTAIDTMKNTIGVLVGDGYQSSLDSNRSATVTIFYDSSKDLLEERVSDIKTSIEQLSQNLLLARLNDQKLPQGFVKPIDLREQNIAPQDRVIGKIMGRFLPMMLLLFIFTGCIYIAIDITAGEKERRTLQTLFTAPLKVSEIIAGKFLATYTVGLVSATMNVLSLLVAMYIQVQLLSGGKADEAFSLPIGPEGWAWMALIIVLATAFMAAISIAVVLLANSYKEAQSYVSPLMMIIIIPALMSQLPGMDLTATTAMIPILNISLAIGAIFQGIFNVGHILIVVFFALLYAGLALYLASLTFGNENVVTGDKVKFKALFSKR
ncbi:MAG: ABC transporter permease [Saprospiraceae bacterium]|nr:ABC transporter permease [Saprospiraceae bacterium]